MGYYLKILKLRIESWYYGIKIRLINRGIIEPNSVEEFGSYEE